MVSLCDDPLYLKVSGSLDQVSNRINESVHRQRERREANKKKSELQIQMAAQLKMQDELRARLAQDTARAADTGRLCVELQERLTIAITDKTRLDTAKEIYHVAKELTGVRWDFTASQNTAKGYIKSTQKKMLEPFQSVRGDNAERTIWTRTMDVHCGRHSQWYPILQHAQRTGQLDKENTPSN